jgi:hypothetical protein
MDRISAMHERDEDSRKVFIGEFEKKGPLRKLGMAGRIISGI